MAKSVKIPASDEAWETGQLGRDSHHAQRVEVDESKIDAALALQLISIRLPVELIDDFKMIAQINNMGYQPLMRQVLKRFADGEKRQILRDIHDQAIKDRRRQENEAAKPKPKAA